MPKDLQALIEHEEDKKERHARHGRQHEAAKSTAHGVDRRLHGTSLRGRVVVPMPYSPGMSVAYHTHLTRELTVLTSAAPAADIVDGPVFRPVNNSQVVQAERLSDKAVVRAVKRGVERAGIDPDLYAGHSLCTGLATSAAAAGVSERAIMNQTGHRSVAVARRYIRERPLFRENASAAVGL